MHPDRIQREITIAAPPQRVWALITRAEHVGRWFGDAGAEIDLRPGGAMTITWARHGTARCRIEAVEPHSRFAFRWTPGDVPDGGEPVEGNSTTLVEFTLHPEAEGRATRLRVVESGFSTLDGSAAERARAFEGNAEGWTDELAELADYAVRATA